jgi:hypothetical protein
VSSSSVVVGIGGGCIFPGVPLEAHALVRCALARRGEEARAVTFHGDNGGDGQGVGAGQDRRGPATAPAAAQETPIFAVPWGSDGLSGGTGAALAAEGLAAEGARFVQEYLEPRGRAGGWGRRRKPAAQATQAQAAQAVGSLSEQLLLLRGGHHQSSELRHKMRQQPTLASTGRLHVYPKPARPPILRVYLGHVDASSSATQTPGRGTARADDSRRQKLVDPLTNRRPRTAPVGKRT